MTFLAQFVRQIDAIHDTNCRQQLRLQPFFEIVGFISSVLIHELTNLDAESGNFLSATCNSRFCRFRGFSLRWLFCRNSDLE